MNESQVFWERCGDRIRLIQKRVRVPHWWLLREPCRIAARKKNIAHTEDHRSQRCKQRTANRTASRKSGPCRVFWNSVIWMSNWVTNHEWVRVALLYASKINTLKVTFYYREV